MTQLTLPSCVLPGCLTPVTAWGDACSDCVSAFGPMLQPGHRLGQAEIEARDTQVQAAYARRRANA